MPIKTIQQLIKGEYLAVGQVVHVPVKSVCIDVGLSSVAKDLISQCGLVGKALVVSDVNTHAVLGSEIELSLGVSLAQSLIFESGVKADISNVEKIKKAAASADYIIAVGSGTINDLCKYASFLINKPYSIFGTAPSMNGYGSANASISISGHKKTLKAHLPQGIFLDLDVLANAPLRLIRSGLGDSICRSTAQADWLVSHLVLGTFYTDVPFLILREFENQLFENSATLIKGDLEIMRLLAATLVLSGFCMYIAGGSYPASQGEHMLAHTMEMLYGDSDHCSYHGEQIAVTTLFMSKLQEKILSGKSCILRNVSFPKLITNNPLLLKECKSEYEAKQFTSEKLSAINNILNNWHDIAAKISAVVLPYNTIYSSLNNAGCPLQPADIGWDEEKFSNAASFARFTRGRFTFLDLSAD